MSIIKVKDKSFKYCGERSYYETDDRVAGHS